MSHTTGAGVGTPEAGATATPASAVVMGAGTMGRGIAQLLAQAGARVALCDARASALDEARAALSEVVARLAAKGRLKGSPEALLARLSYHRALPADDGVSWVFEAVVEDLEVKRGLFAEVAAAFPSARLATNTSTLSVTAIAAGCPQPERVVGLHFFNPAPLMPLVEVIAGARTPPGLVEEAAAVARALGRTPVIARDRPGFIVNRVARPFYGEALRLAGEGVPIDVIDLAARGAGFRMGPFELLDLIGIDVNLAATASVFEAFFQEPRYRPHPLQRAMVQAGRLGRKSGRGFYGYDPGAQGPPAPGAAPAAADAPPAVRVLGDGAAAAALRRHLRAPDADAPPALVLDARVRPDDADLPHDLADRPLARLCWAASASRTQALLGRPVAGFSFATPPDAPPVVELMLPEGTEPGALEPVEAALAAHGLATLHVPDTAGGIAFRLVALLVNEAVSALAEGLAEADAIDTAMRLGVNYPRGPLAWGAELGLADVEAGLRGLLAELGAERFAPQPLLARLAAVGAERVPPAVGAAVPT